MKQITADDFRACMQYMKCVPRVMYVGSTAVVVSAAAASRRGVVDASSWRAKATVNMMHCGSQSVRQR